MSEAAQHLASILHPGRNPLSELLERLQANGWIICPPGHVPQDEAHPDGSAPHTRPVQQFDIGARQAPPEQTCPLGQVPSGLPGPHGVATQAPLAHSLPTGHVPHEPTLQVLGPQARPAQEQAVPLSTTLWVTHAPAAHACPARQSPHDP